MTDATPAVQQSLTERAVAGVRAEMKRRQVTERELAAILGLHQPNVNLRLRGRRPFKMAELDTIAAAWGITADQLISAADFPAGAA